MKTVAVLGYKGFVGSAVHRHFVDAGRHDVTGIDMEEYPRLKGRRFDVLINADGSSDKPLAARNPQLDFDLNVRATLYALLDFPCDRYVHISSNEVYNDLSDPSRSREDAMIEPEKLPNYGFGKYLGELVVRKYARRWVIFRLGSMVGEGIRKNPVYDLIHRRKLFVHPSSLFQFIGTADVARVIEMLIEKEGEVFNVCGKGVVRLQELADRFGIEIREWGRDELHYETNTQKLEGYVDLPTSRSVAIAFMEAQLGRTR